MSKKPTYEELESKIQQLEQNMAILRNASNDGTQFELSQSKHFKPVSLVGATGTTEQINRLKAAEAKRDQYQKLLASTLDAVDSLLIVIDRNYRIVLCNWKGHEWLPESERALKQFCYKAMKNFNGPCENCRAAITFKDGKTRWYEDQNPIDGSYKEISVIPIFDALGKVEYVLENVRDITQRKQAEEALKDSEERYRQLFEMESDAIFLIENETGNILEANKAASQIYGYTREELLTKKNTDMSAEPDKTSQATKLGLKTIPTRYHKKNDGSVFPVEITATHFSRQGQGVHIAAIRDISVRVKSEEEKVELEKRLQQAQKMEAIGNLAGGIAHDFNNILFPIVGMSEILLEDMSPGTLKYGNMQEILNAGRRGSELVKQIMAFSRQSDHEMIPMAIQMVVSEVLNLVRATIPSNIEIVQDIQGDCGLVMADPTQIHQITMNLITNAYHAMENEGGAIHVRLKETKAVLGDAPGSAGESARCAMLSISDTGCGIDPAIQDKIFEPYFTTKETGKGTGLGLAVVYGIVKEHGGSIILNNDVEKGTTFDVYLPLMDKPAMPMAVKQLDSVETGSEHILLVDDEASIARLETQMIERLGYQVTTCEDSAQVLKIFSASPQLFDLVITDMTMPGMTGDRLAEELISIRPDIPVILCTGFSERLKQDNTAPIGIKRLLMKPFGMGQIANAIRSVLDENKPQAR